MKPDKMSEEIMQRLKKYSKVTTDKVKSAVKSAANLAKKEISATAPIDTGAYSKSWRVKNTRETATSLAVTVHSKTRYRLAHLLENGHAKRNGGRVAGRKHIAPAEEKAISQLTADIKKAIKNG